jgi:hypothetical protein
MLRFSEMVWGRDDKPRKLMLQYNQEISRIHDDEKMDPAERKKQIKHLRALYNRVDDMSRGGMFEDIPANSMGASSSTPGTGAIDMFDPILRKHKKKNKKHKKRIEKMWRRMLEDMMHNV